MYYVNFEAHVTARFGIVLENWPVQKFAAPGSFSSIPTLTVIYNAFESGATRFRSLTDDEWTTWMIAYKAGESALAVASTSPLAAIREGQPSTPASSLPHDVVSDTTAPVAPAAPAPEPAPEHALPPAPTAPPEAPMHPMPAADADGMRGEKRSFEQALSESTTAVPAPSAVFINSVAGSAGTGVVHVTKKPRKERSDKGKKKGPRQQPTATAQLATSSSPL